jgi:hypothetical protein
MALIVVPALETKVKETRTRALLSYDAIHHIIQWTNIGYVSVTLLVIARHLSKEETEKLRRDRISPLLYMSSLVQQRSLALLALMNSTGTALSGSRAAGYFAPGACKEDSDWDFYCCAELGSIYSFVSWSRLIGFEWEKPNYATERHFVRREETETETENPYRSSGFVVLRGTVKRATGSGAVQLIWGAGESAIDSVTAFHSTAPQCLIFGFCAVSLYHLLTSRSLAVYWKRSDSSEGKALTLQQKRTSMRARDKYSSRGFRYIEHSAYTAMKDTLPLCKRLKHKFRRVGDKESYIVPFDGFASAETWKNTCELLSRGLRYDKWEETEDRTSSFANCDDPPEYTKTDLEYFHSVGKEWYDAFSLPSHRMHLPLSLPGRYSPLCSATADYEKETREFHSKLNAESGGAFGDLPAHFREEASSLNSMIDLSVEDTRGRSVVLP